MANEPDPTAAALVLRDLAWVKELARRLLGDPELAEDVAHDAWIAARTQPPARLDSGIRAWLATVVHHGVQRVRRGERRRREREAAVAVTAAVTSDGDVVERGALCRELSTVVMELDEPYRSAILLRYLDGLSTADVAARQQVSPVAARKRLSRALQLLRERLDGAHVGGFAAWSIAWRGQFGLTAPGAVAGAAGISVWLMNTKWMAAAFAALVAMFLSWQWWPRPVAVAPVNAGAATVAEHAAVPDATDDASPAPALARSAAQATFVIEVVDGAGAPQVDVAVFALAGGVMLQQATSDGAGRVELTHVARADELLLAAAGAMPLRTRCEAGERQRIVFPFGEVVDGVAQRPAGADGDIVLRLEHDRDAASALGLAREVVQRLESLGVSANALHVRLPADGRFAFRGLPVGWTGALTTDGAWTLREPTGRGSLDDGTTLLLLQPARDLQLELTAPFTVRGRLLAGGAPAAGLTAMVLVQEQRRGGGLRTATSDGDGRFAVGVPRPLHDSTWRGELLVSSATAGNLLQRRLEAAASDVVVDVGDLDVGRAMVFVVRGADGAPLAGAAVHVVGGSRELVAADTDAAGRADVFGVPPAATWASVQAHGHRTAVVQLPAEGEVAVALVAGNGVDVQVVDHHGAPVRDLQLRVEADRLPFELAGQQPAGAARPFVQAFPLDAEGHRELADLAPGVLLRLVVVDGGDQEVGRAEVVTPPIGRIDAVRIEVSSPTFVCRGRVVDERGRPVPRVRIHAEHDDEAMHADTDADGRFELGPLRTSVTGVHLEANHPAFAAWLRNDVALHADAVLDIVLAPGRTLRAHVRQQNGAPVAITDAWIAFDDAPTCLGRAGDAGELLFLRAAARPGRLVVRLGGREWSQPFGAGDSDVELRLPDLGTVSITVPPELRDTAAERICVVVTPLAPAGDDDRRYRPRDFDPSGPAWVLPLPPGSYRCALEARRFGGGGPRVRVLGTREVEVAPGAALQLVLP